MRPRGMEWPRQSGHLSLQRVSQRVGVQCRHVVTRQQPGNGDGVLRVGEVARLVDVEIPAGLLLAAHGHPPPAMTTDRGAI